MAVTTEEILRRLSPQAGECLHVERSDQQLIEVRELAPLRWLHFGGNAIQSVMSIDAPALPLQPYNIAMLGTLLFQPRPKRMLNLGFGGGTFERFFRAYYPELALTSVEANATVIQLAKRFFHIPDDYPVINEAAENFLARNHKRNDLVFCDIFDVHYHPACLFDNHFYLQALNRLTASGVFAVNLLPATESELLAILLAIRQHFPWTLLLEIPDQRNIVLFGLRQEAPDIAALESAAAALAIKTGVDMTSLPTRLTRLPMQPQWG